MHSGFKDYFFRIGVLMTSLRSYFGNPYVEEHLKYMFAKNIPALKGAKEICSCLQELDIEEERCQEPYISTTSKISKVIAGFCLSSGAITMYLTAGGVKGLRETLEGFSKPEISGKVFGVLNLTIPPISATLVTFITSFFALYMTRLLTTERDREPYKMLESFSNRLQYKIFILQNSIKNASQINEKKQLKIAKRFFNNELKVLSRLLELPYGVLCCNTVMASAIPQPSMTYQLTSSFQGPPVYRLLPNPQYHQNFFLPSYSREEKNALGTAEDYST